MESRNCCKLDVRTEGSKSRVFYEIIFSDEARFTLNGHDNKPFAFWGRGNSSQYSPRQTSRTKMYRLVWLCARIVIGHFSLLLQWMRCFTERWLQNFCRLNFTNSTFLTFIFNRMGLQAIPLELKLHYYALNFPDVWFQEMVMWIGRRNRVTDIVGFFSLMLFEKQIIHNTNQ